MAYEIVGADGTMMGPEDGELVMLVEQIEGYQRQGMEVPEHIGAALPMLFGRASAAPRPSTMLQSLARSGRLANALSAVRTMPALRNLRLTPPGQPTVQTVQPGPIREVVQGLDSGPVLVGAGAQAVITFNASMVYRPTRLQIGADLAPLWVVDDIRVSADSLFLSAGAVPATVFVPDGVGSSALKRRTAQPGTPVAVIVTNIDGAPHRFRGALFGEGTDMGSC